MPRNKLGQFEKGTCGNPRGRPRNKRLEMTNERLRQDFFDAAETLVPIVENGKRKLVPASRAIDMQLTLKAASGNMKAISEFHKRRDRMMIERLTEQLTTVERILEGEEVIRRFPEDVTDEFKQIIAELRTRLNFHLH